LQKGWLASLEGFTVSLAGLFSASACIEYDFTTFRVSIFGQYALPTGHIA